MIEMMRTKRLAFAAGAVIVMAAFLGGCARLDYVKVPSPTQYDTWTDEDQRRADAMNGVRYYLPRPFVHLKEPVPVAQRVALVSFAFDGSTGTFEAQLPDDAPTWLIRSVPKRISIRQALAASLAQPARGEPGRLESDEEAEPAAPAAPIEGERPPTELTARTGFISDTDPVTRLSERMDVVYLPDFEEQYVIQPHGGMGTVDVETKLRNGWAAEVFQQKIDNSNLIPYVIRQVERASEAAAGIAKTWGPMFAGVPLPLPTGEGALESDEAAAAIEMLGELLLFKVAEVKTAQPGLYPILKPREIRHWLGSAPLVSGRDPQETFEAYIEQANVPWIRPDMAFIPCPPFTVIGFNVTTDVFFAPATERTVPPAGDDGAPRLATADVTVIKEALTSAPPQRSLRDALNVNAARVRAADFGRATEISIDTQPSADLDDDELKAQFAAWLTAALGEQVSTSSVTIEMDESIRRAVTARIAKPLATVAAAIPQ